MTESISRMLWTRFRRHRLAVLGAVTVLVLVLMAVFASLVEKILGVQSTSVDLQSTVLPPLTSGHLLGTDELGRDVFARLLHGGRISLSVGVIAALSSALIGTCVGLVAGYAGGWLDALLMRIADAMLSIPVLPLLIVLSAVDMQKLLGFRLVEDSHLGSVVQLIVLIVMFGWMTVARLARAAALQLKSLDYVTAARALGASNLRILAVHILPGALPPIVVAATLEVGSNILYEASLSFLGLGVKPPVPSWGNMLTNAQDLMYRAPLLALWPGLLIFITVSAFNFLGDGLRDALDPRQVFRRA